MVSGPISWVVQKNPGISDHGEYCGVVRTRLTIHREPEAMESNVSVVCRSLDRKELILYWCYLRCSALSKNQQRSSCDNKAFITVGGTCAQGDRPSRDLCVCMRSLRKPPAVQLVRETTPQAARCCARLGGDTSTVPRPMRLFPTVTAATLQRGMARKRPPRS